MFEESFRSLVHYRLVIAWYSAAGRLDPVDMHASNNIETKVGL